MPEANETFPFVPEPKRDADAAIADLNRVVEEMESEIPEWMRRLTVELAELQAKLMKLRAFLEDKEREPLAPIQEHLLGMQYQCMATYEGIMILRMANNEQAGVAQG